MKQEPYTREGRNPRLLRRGGCQFKITQRLDIPVKVFHCTREYENIHNVPLNVIAHMKDRYESFRGEESI